MLVVLPFIAFTLLTLTLQVTEHSWRRAALAAAVMCGLVFTGITEALSLFHALTAAWLAVLWAGIVVTSGIVCWTRLTHGTLGRPLLAPPSAFLTGLIAALGVIIGATGLIALVAPPNTWDSLIYHMSRVMHWIQNRTVAHYPTHIQRQLHHTPWAEFAILHLQLLSGSDRFANVVQWLSMIGSVTGVSLLAQQLGADARGQIFSAVVAATIPMGILQASSTQTDYVVSFWLVCCVHYGLRLRERGIRGPLDCCALGVAASLGLAVLTKPTAYVYALPFLLWFLTAGLRTSRRTAWPAILICIGLTFGINAGHYARNIGLYGSLLGPMEADLPHGRYANDDISFSLFASNLARNIALHLQTPSETINASVEEGIHLFHGMIGAGIDDPRTTFSNARFRILPPLFDEDGDGNLLHLLLVILTLGLILCLKPLRGMAGVVAYLLALTSAFVLFSVCLKWQPYNSRLHLPLFVLWSPLIGLSLAWSLRHRLINGVLILTLLASLPWLLLNNHRPLIGPHSLFAIDRTALYFVVQPTSEAPFKQTAQQLEQLHCFKVGLRAAGNVPEYLLWVVLQRDRSNVRIEHVSVMNPSAVFMSQEPFRSFAACRTIVLEESSVDR